MARSVAFGGYSLNAVDAKGRVSFPADLRHLVERRAAAAPAEDGIEANKIYVRQDSKRPCLVGFDDVEYCRLSLLAEQGVEGLSAEEQALDGAAVLDDIFGNLEHLSFDAAGRMVLNQMCRDITGIEKFAFFRGTGTRFEIWEPKRLHAWASKEGKTPIVRTVEYSCRDKGIAL